MTDNSTQNTQTTNATDHSEDSVEKVLALIRKAELKRVAKRKIIQFLKNKGIPEPKIIEAYQQYYKEEKLYEITFPERPLGFSVIMDTRGKNAIVSSIQNETNTNSGLKMASRMYEVNGVRVDDLKHKEILKIVNGCECPFYVVFKESAKDAKKLEKLQKKVKESVWVNEQNEESESDGSDRSTSSEESSYSSDDDVSHVEHHHKHKKKEKDKPQQPPTTQDDKRNSRSKGIFKFEEIGKWNEGDLDSERGAMVKELAKLMVNAAVSNVATEDPTLQAMSETRKATLTKLVDSTPKDNKSMTFELSELRTEDDEETAQYDPEIIKYLQDLMGGDDKNMSGLTTPSMSLVMNNMWTQEDLMREDDDDHNEANGDVSLHLPANAFKQGSNDNNSNTEEKSEQTGDVLTQMKEGTTLLKYGKYGSGGYRTFRLSKDHKYLVWFSQKKNAESTRVPIEEIMEIRIGKESDVVRKTKEEEIHETSFTVVYGKDGKQLNVTAKSPKEAYVWAQGLKILSDAAKRGTNISDLKSLDVEKEKDKNDSKHGRTNSVVISMNHVRSQSVVNMFQKNADSNTVAALAKRHMQLKTQLQKCVEFVMTKKNYKVIKSKGEFQNLKVKLEKIDTRLRHVKGILESENPNKDLSECKAELFSISADLDALRQMLTALIRQQKVL